MVRRINHALSIAVQQQRRRYIKAALHLHVVLSLIHIQVIQQRQKSMAGLKAVLQNTELNLSAEQQPVQDIIVRHHEPVQKRF